LAFAASSNTTRRLLLEQKPFWSGIEGLLVDGNLAKALNLPQPAGVLVQRVAEGSLAWRWGIHAGTQRANVEGQELVLGGDIILGVNDVPVEEGGGDIYASIIKLKPGDNLSIKLFRRGQIVKLSLPVAL
jgi:serine protease Do